MSLCGRRLIHWVVASMREQGIRDFVMVTQGKQNRHQVMALLGFGEDLGVRVRYSQP